jgi:hypothetical protein
LHSLRLSGSARTPALLPPLVKSRERLRRGGSEPPAHDDADCVQKSRSWIFRFHQRFAL